MKKAKQFLAMLLCLAMVAAVLPANAPQAAAADGELTELYYDFAFDIQTLKEKGGGTQDTAFQFIQATSYTETGRNWCLYNYPVSAWSGVSTKWDGRLSFAGTGLQLCTDTAARWVALELDVTQAANYDLTLNYAKFASGGVAEIYMFPTPAEKSEASVAACLTAANLKGSVNFADSSNPGNGFSAGIGSINVETAGKYILAIRGTAADDGNFAFVSGLKLSPKGVYTYSLRTYKWDGSGEGFTGFDGGNWTLAAKSSTVALYDNSTWVIAQFKGFAADGDYVAFELKNVISGEYTVSMDAQRSTASVAADFYLIPKCDAADIIANCTDEYFIGNHDNYANPSEGEPSAFTFEKKAQAAKDGNYILVAKRTSAKATAADRLQFTNVKLVRCGDVKPEGYKKYTFNFVGATWGGANSNNFIAYGNESKGWKHYAENNLTVQTNWKADGNGWDYVAIRDVNNSNNWVALQLYNLKAGKYDATINAYMNPNYPKVELFFIPVCDASQIAGKLTAPKSLGDVDTNDAAASFEKKAIPVEKSINVPEDGNYLLVMRGKNSNPTATLHLNSLEMERVGECEEVAEVYAYSLRTLNDKTNYKTHDNGSWKYYASSDSVTMVDHQNWTTPMFQNFNVGDYLAFEIKNLESGAYDVSAEAWTTSVGCRAEYYIMPKCDVSKIAENLKRDNKYYIGEHNNYTRDQVTGVEVDFTNAAQLEADGNYLLVMKCIARMSDGSHNIRIANFELERTGDYVEPIEPSNFGDHYAYMTKVGDICKLTVIGGIKDIEGYSKVGFEVSVNGSVAQAKSSKNVYETINYDGAAIDTSKLGADVEYLFYETFEMSAAEFAAVESLSFKAFAVGAEGNEYGAEYALPLN